LRTNFRAGEDVFSIAGSPDGFRRKVLLDYLRQVNSLKASPEWYRRSGQLHDRHPAHTNRFTRSELDWRLIANATFDGCCKNGGESTGPSFVELRNADSSPEASLAATEDFSRGSTGIAGMEF
jgi:hypothetical protein